MDTRMTIITSKARYADLAAAFGDRRELEAREPVVDTGREVTFLLLFSSELATSLPGSS